MRSTAGARAVVGMKSGGGVVDLEADEEASLLSWERLLSSKLEIDMRNECFAEPGGFGSLRLV